MERYLTRLGLGAAALMLSAGIAAAQSSSVQCEDYDLKADMCVSNGFTANNQTDPSKWMLSPDAWSDACMPNRVGWKLTQGAADQFSWRKFTALVWPASDDQNGQPNEKEMLGLTLPDGAGAPVVWETYKPIEQVFNYDDPNWTISPDDWNKDVGPPSVCPQIEGARVLTHTAKAPPLTGLTDAHGPLQLVNQAVGGPLVDQAGNLVLYEIMVNKTMFDHLATTGAYKKGFDTTGFTFPEGSTEVKAAWKVLSDTEWNSGAFFNRVMLHYTPADESKTGAAVCVPKRMGLVGLHIASKTPLTTFDQYPKAATWFWSTFEQKNNAPLATDQSTDTDNVDYSFYNESCTPAVTAAQCAQVSPKNSTPIDTAAYACCNNLLRYGPIGPKQAALQQTRTPIQVTRLDPELPTAATCNDVYHTAMADAQQGIQDPTPPVWENYILRGTQWPKASDGAPAPPEITPAHNRNVTMETYLTQWDSGETQSSTSSCMGCHQFGVDMSFTFTAAAEEAKDGGTGE